MLHFLRARIVNAFSLSSAKKKGVFASVDGKESLSFFLSVKSVADASYTYTRTSSEREKEFIELRLSPGALRVRLRER